MKSTFFIAGYPRTRTAWLSNLLTYGPAFCFHEAVKWAPPEELSLLFGSTQRPFVGTADSTLPFYIDEVWDRVPNPRLVVVERDAENALASFLAYGKGLDEGELREVHRKTGEALSKAKERYNPLVVDYEDLARPSVCQAVWEYCVPGEPFDERRWLMLDSFNVQVSLQRELTENDPEALERVGELIRRFPA